ncbi:MAG: J domain-containing protein, partial [Myxococcota bacterium]
AWCLKLLSNLPQEPVLQAVGEAPVASVPPAPRARGTGKAGVEDPGGRSASSVDGRADAPIKQPEEKTMAGRESDEASLKARRSRLIKRAFRNIPGAERFGSSAPAPAPAPKGGMAEKSAVPASDGSKALSPAALALSREIKTLADVVEKQDFYRRLGLQRTASETEIKNSYLSRVKRFHPDRGSAFSLPEEDCRQLKKIFEAMQEAYETLRDREARKSYDSSTGSDRGERDRARVLARAEIDFKKGEALFKKKDHARALEYLKAAVEVDPKNEGWLMVFAWTKFNLGPKEKVKEEVQALLRRAAASPNDKTKARASYYLGLIFRMDGNLEKAEKYFSSAVEHDPKLLEAASELREIRRKLGKAGSKDGAKGLFKKMLGKG